MTYNPVWSYKTEIRVYKLLAVFHCMDTAVYTFFFFFKEYSVCFQFGETKNKGPINIFMLSLKPSFHLIGTNSYEWIATSHGKTKFSFVRN